MKTAVKYLLKDQVRPSLNDPEPGSSEKEIMFCLTCGAEYSANSGDYFNVPDNHTFQCCNRDLQLTTKSVVYS